MFKVRKVYVLILAAAMLQMLVMTSAAAFGFSNPVGSVVAGPGLWAAGPTTFNTYFHEADIINTGAVADTAVNAFPLCGPGYPFCAPGVPFFGPGCIPGVPFGFSPYGVANAANAGAGSSIATDDTFATSFSTAGGVAAPGYPGLIQGHLAGAFPQFALNFF